MGVYPFERYIPAAHSPSKASHTSGLMAKARLKLMTALSIKFAFNAAFPTLQYSTASSCKTRVSRGPFKELPKYLIKIKIYKKKFLVFKAGGTLGPLLNVTYV